MREINTYDIEVMRRTMTAKQIAAVYNITPNALYHWCRRHGTIIIRATDWEIKEALETMTVKEAAYALNITPSIIYNRRLKWKRIKMTIKAEVNI